MEVLQNIPTDFWFTFATIIATIILGYFSKKYEIVNTKKIPLQNIAIGIIVCIIEYAITKDFSTALAISGVLSGGVYDVGKSIKKLIEKGEE